MSEEEKEKMIAAVREGVHSGFKALMEDSEAVEKFWKGGYTELTKHASDASSQWVGKRILAAVITAVFIWCMSWLVQNGGIK